ncbi:WGR domain-containing protein [Gluconacetobacter tumulicola]|uniref:WGR domain-containing protein n=1 Tax=Gluconacetobacter tumulicola TaxID=1017177 RepID=UPI0030844422
MPAANCWRFYRLCLRGDLFGGTALLRQWGRIGTARQCRLDLHADDAARRSFAIGIRKTLGATAFSVMA